MADWYRASLVKPARFDDPPDDDERAAAAAGIDSLPFTARRSPVICRHAAVATSQPLASSVGYDILKQGGNAADAAVAIAAALAVTEPCSTGLGGDMFCLYYDAATRTVSCLNGSGASPDALTLDLLQQAYPDGNGGVNAARFRDSALSVTVPGAAAGWEDLWRLRGSGKFSFSHLLEPAAVLAEEGFPVAPVTSYHWRAGMVQILKWLDDGDAVPLTGASGQAPAAGEVVTNPDMARVLRDLGAHGAVDGFYHGTTGQAVVAAVQKNSGCLTMDDLAAHRSDNPAPISAAYRGCHMWQAPPNGQGVAGLIALAGLHHLEEQQHCPAITPETIGSANAYHSLMEMMRLGLADARTHVADANHMTVDCEWLLNADRIGKRAAALFRSDRAVIQGVPDAASCTVSFQVVDAQGNAISFVNSNFQGFGTGIVPDGCGFTLQNRGSGFHLEAGHHNIVAPRKRPFHTIIPCLLTHSDTGEFYATLSNMGGNMQPQGHLQLAIDMVAGNLDPQAAIDMPRFCILDGTHDGIVFLEEGVDESVVKELQRRGHKLKAGIKGHERSIFGRAQIIKRDRATNVLWAGSDGRADGCAMGF